MSFIAWLPDWIFFFIIGIIAFIVYYNFPEDVKQSTRKFMREYGVYVVLVLVGLYFHHQWGNIGDSPTKWPATMNRATFFFGLGIILYFAFDSWLFRHRYYTNHFVCDNVQGSCHRWHYIGNVGEKKNPWVVAMLGGSGLSDESWVLPWPFPKKIVIVPSSTCQFLGNQLVANCKVEKVSSAELLEINEDLNNFIKNDAMARRVLDEVYIGYAKIETLTSDPEFNALKEDLIKKDSRINELKEMLRGKLTTVKGFVADTMGMSNKLKDRDWRSRQANRGSGDE